MDDLRRKAGGTVRKRQPYGSKSPEGKAIDALKAERAKGGRIRNRPGAKGGAFYVPNTEIKIVANALRERGELTWEALHKGLRERGWSQSYIDHPSTKEYFDVYLSPAGAVKVAGKGQERGDIGAPSSALSAGACLVLVSCMLLWALLGNPPYPFYQFMRWSVAGTCLYAGYVVFQLHRAFAPVSVVLLGEAGTYIVGNFKRQDWELVNLATLIVMLLTIVSLFIGARRFRSL